MAQMTEPQPLRGNLPEMVAHVVKFVGGSAAVTKTYGPGCTVAYVDTGKVTLTWATGAHAPGEFIGLVGTFQAATPGNVKAYVLVPDTYDTTTCSVELHLFESGTLTDLAASEWLTVTAYFAKADV